MKSRYLVDHRLADVLAAIQVMGSTIWDSRPIADWCLYLGDKPQSAHSWEELLREHPEFFGDRVDRKGYHLYFLRLRRAYQRTIDPNGLRELTEPELQELKRLQVYDDTPLARRALTPDQVAALMKTAIELQTRAAALADRARWWIPLAAAVLGFVGAILGSLLK